MALKKAGEMLLLMTVVLFAGACFGENYTPGELAGGNEVQVPVQDGDPAFWQVDEWTRLYHFDQGEGKPVLVIHGGPGVPFDGVWPGFEEIQGYRFHYYHQRGCGLSTIPFDSFSGSYPDNMKLLESRLGLEQNLLDIERIRMILGTEKLILIGHSFGGFLASLYASEYPERVSRMVLVEPADMLRLPNAHGGMAQVEQYLPVPLAKEYRAFSKEYFNFGKLFKRTEEELAGLTNRYARFYTAALEELYPGCTEDLAMGNPAYTGGFASFAVFFSLGRKYDHRDLLKKISCPVLVVHGKKDIYSPDTAGEYAQLLPQGVYTEMENSSHFPFYEEPEAFRDSIAGFLAQGL